MLVWRALAQNQKSSGTCSLLGHLKHCRRIKFPRAKKDKHERRQKKGSSDQKNKKRKVEAARKGRERERESKEEAVRYFLPRKPHPRTDLNPPLCATTYKR